MERTRVLITGGTRGFGFALAGEFLKLGARVHIAGRSREAVDMATHKLMTLDGDPAAADYDGAPKASGSVCDVANPADTDRLAQEAIRSMGGIDLWVNNAGVNQLDGKLWELSPEESGRVFHTNVGGALNGARSAIAAMKGSGGAIWFVEGHGSNGMIIDGLSLYGTSKRALAYVWRALARETKDLGIKVNAISPGIMATDFILEKKSRVSEAEWEKSKRAFNILADLPETVARHMAPRMLATTSSGTLLSWLTTGKILWRFVSAPFSKRVIIE
jgi:NAD(P)-dependent dehydrogenase (short-subunit alcohol dehydrogenase family)